MIGPADLDGDGLPDFVRAGFWGLVPMISQGNGMFVEGLGPPWIVNGWQAGFADIDGNGTQEMVYPELFSNGIGTAVSFATYDGVTATLVPQSTVATPPCTGTRTGDFNGDGAVDILISGVAPGGATEFLVLVGNGLGTGFTTVGPFPMLATVVGAGPVIETPMIGDVTGDGVDDVLAITDVAGTYSLHAGVAAVQGTGVLSPPVAITVPWTVCNPVAGLRQRVADIDADGIDDLVVAGCIAPGFGGNISPLMLRVYRGLPGNAFRPPYDTQLIPSTDYDYGPTSFDLVDADFDGDLDIAYVNLSWLTSDLWAGFGRNLAVLGPGTGVIGAGGVPTLTLSPAAPGLTISATLAGALPGATVAAGVSLGAFMPGVAAGPIWIDTSAPALILPTPAVGVFVASATGTATLTASIPPSVMPGLTLFTQWIAGDPLGGVALFGLNWTASDARTLVIY